MRPPLIVTLLIAALLQIPATSAAQDGRPADDGQSSTSPEDKTLSLRASIKGSAFIFHAPDAPLFFPDRNGAETLWRVRIEPTINATNNTRFEFAYEHRLAYTSSGTSVATLGILPPIGEAPYRIRQLDWSVAASSNGQWRQEVDRANAKIEAGRADVTLGRQAIGWGRGVLFGAVDLFAPFSPLEADREWRRGIDAARADVKVSNRASVEGVGAFGPTWDRSLVAARIRGYRGTVDLEAMGGRRAQDVFGGTTASAAVGDAELHGEAAAFHIPEPLPLGTSTTIWKAVAGGSYRFAIGSGLMVFAEYHYSGFGARKAADIVEMLADPGYLQRFLRGDTQILLRHATGVLASYEQSPMFSYSAQWVETPVDASGVMTPAMTVTFNDQLSLYIAGYVAYGKAPRGVTLQSEYGVTPTSLFSQLRMYF